MAATMASLLKATVASKPVTLPLKWRNPLLRTTQITLPSIKKSTTTTGFIKCSSSRGSKFSLQCVMNSKNCFMEEDDKERKRKQNPFERFAEVMLKTLQKPAVIMALLLGALLAWTALLFGVLHSYDPATAASRTAIILGVMLLYDLYRVISAFSPDSRRRNGGSIQSSSTPALGLILIVIAAFMLLFGLVSVSLVQPSSKEESAVDTQKSTVFKLQVALLGTTRSLQRDLDRIRIAGTADTSTSEGFGKVLQETTSALLRHPDYCISGYSSVDVKQNKEDGEKHFNKLSIEERGESDAETLVNVNTIKRQSTTSNIKIIVITMLVAAEGVHELPSINGCADLKEALQKFGSISSSKTMAVEVLWTPRNENDTLTEQELLEDYPLLRPL